MVLMQTRIHTLEKINRTINKQHKIKKTRIQQKGVLSVQNANTLLNVREVDTQLEKKIRTNNRSRGGGRTIVRRYSNCSKPRHNTRTYKKDEEISNVYSSD